MQVAQGGLAFTMIHPDELRRRLSYGERFAVIDARSESSRRSSGETMPGAIRLPADGILSHKAEIPRGRSLLLLADLAAQESVALELLGDGYADVFLIEGGFDAFLRAGGPTEPIR
ncbi:hypothetical protein [Vulgatibacter incomptus]|uniref:Rhodanese domain-containing protein n=1 Tax=Vulgatibacter incomptus TaxID=1391653 RepID=A0A0K1PDZ5_9BACT|nr:hypothetical protein [Vulgatibacter incomptus]AKU91730.1 hypothetical protein AKJ08_2117 [Vulgatibacter incomptus]